MGRRSTYKIVWLFIQRCLVPNSPLTSDFFNLDGVVYVLLLTFFNPLFMWLLNIRYKYIVTSLWILRYINNRLREGPKRSHLKKSLLITGGSRGLGKEIVTEFHDKLDIDQIIIIDVEEPEFKPENVIYIQHDFSIDNNGQDLIKEIERNVPISEIGLVICNAGVRQETGLINSSKIGIFNIVNVNWIQQISLIQQILAKRIKSQNYTHILGVSSVLGFLSPKNLGVYSGTKSAFLNTLDSLRHETNRDLVSVSCIIPGQLDTKMFDDKNVNRILAPVIQSKKLARRISEIVDSSSNGEFVYPVYGRFLPIVKILPYMIQDLLRSLSGIDN